MRLEMVDGNEWLAGRQRETLAGHEPDQHAPDQPWPGGGGDAVDLAWAPRLRAKRAGDQPVDDLDMGARGDLGNDAAIGGMRRDLAENLVGENAPVAVGPQFDHRRRGLVAGGLNSQNAHRLLDG